MHNFTIKTKLNIFTFIFFIFGLTYLGINFLYYDKTSQNIVDMSSNELMIKNTTNTISKDFFLMNTIVFSNRYLDNSYQLYNLNTNIITNINVIKNYATKNNQELLKYILNIEIRYNSYYAMVKKIIDSRNISEFEKEKEEILEGLGPIVLKANQELEQFNYYSDTLFRDSTYSIISNLKDTFTVTVVLFVSSILFLLGLNLLIRKSILTSIDELQSVIEYFVLVLSKKEHDKRPKFTISQQNEIAYIAKEIVKSLPFIEENLEKLRELGLRDELTGLMNRRYLSEISKNLIKIAKRDNQSVAFLMMDIDHFKSVNDTYGHDAGDLILKDFATILLSNVREVDSVIRLGGEEFLVVLLNVKNIENALKIANQIRNHVGKFDFVIQDNIILHKTVSIGLTLFPDHETEDINILIGKADEALYEAKNSGRDKVVVWK